MTGSPRPSKTPGGDAPEHADLAGQSSSLCLTAAEAAAVLHPSMAVRRRPSSSELPRRRVGSSWRVRAVGPVEDAVGRRRSAAARFHRPFRLGSGASCRPSSSRLARPTPGPGSTAGNSDPPCPRVRRVWPHKPNHLARQTSGRTASESSGRSQCLREDACGVRTRSPFWADLPPLWGNGYGKSDACRDTPCRLCLFLGDRLEDAAHASRCATWHSRSETPEH